MIEAFLGSMIGSLLTCLGLCWYLGGTLRKALSLLNEQDEEIARLRTKTEERKAIANAAAWMSTRLDGESPRACDFLSTASVLRGFLERTEND